MSETIIVEDSVAELLQQAVAVMEAPDLPKHPKPTHRVGKKMEVRTIPKVQRNEKCPCGSGKKYKHCCMKGGSQ